MLREAAIRWVSVNCSSREFRAGFVRHLDRAISLGVNCSFLIGHGLTRVFKPYLLHWFAGELFIFQLTPGQAARLGLGPKDTRFSWDHESVPDGPAPAVLISLESVVLDRPILADLKQPIIAECRYHVMGDPLAAPITPSFKMDFAQGANAGRRSLCLFAHPAVPMSGSGATRLEFEPLHLPPGIAVNKVAAGFLRCVANDSGAWNPISNSVATLMELADGAQRLP